MALCRSDPEVIQKWTKPHDVWHQNAVGALALCGLEKVADIFGTVQLDGQNLDGEHPGFGSKPREQGLETQPRDLWQRVPRCGRGKGHPRDPGHRLLEDLQQLLVVMTESEPGEVSAGPRKAGD